MKAIKSTAFALTLLFLLTGCNSPDASDVVLKGKHFTIISELRHYANWNTGGQTSYRLVRLRVNGRTIADEDASNQLYPKDSSCSSPFYAIRDVRLLPDESALALFSRNDTMCGKAQLARLSVVDGHLKVQRLDVFNFIHGQRAKGDWPTPGVDTDTFGDVYDERLSGLDAQRTTRTTWTSVAQRSSVSGDDWTSNHTVAIHLTDLSLHDLGQGSLERFVGSTPVALMISYDWGDRLNSEVQFRAVDVADSHVIDQVTFSSACYSLTAKAARVLSQADIHTGSFEELASDRESKEEARKQHAAAVASVLGGTYGIKPSIEWDAAKGRLRVGVDELLMRRSTCNDPGVKGMVRGG